MLDPHTERMMMGAAGASGDKVYVDDVFSTYLYHGNANDNTATEQPINNGIDLAGEGGLVWLKHRTGLLGSAPHLFIDTVRGVRNTMESNSNAAQVQGAASNTGDSGSGLQTFNSNGFTLKGQGKQGGANYGQGGIAKYTSWTFRKAPGFFDIVEYSGNGTSSQVIPHNLGSVPGMIILKAKNVADNWKVYHRGHNNGVTPERWLTPLTTDQAESQYTQWWNNTAPTATNFTVGEWNNGSGWDFIAYVFAHDEQVFGTDSDKSIIKCGEYTSNENVQDINLGFEPQWVMVKKVSSTGQWFIFDAMRGVASEQGTTSAGKDMSLYPNLNGKEDSEGDGNKIDFLPNGFRLTGNLGSGNSPINNNGDFIYVAIRRPDGYVGKPPSAGTDVFKVVNDTNTTPRIITPFPVDMALYKHGTLGETFFLATRMTTSPETGRLLQTSNENAESSSSLAAAMDYSNGWINNANNMANYVAWNWKRYSGFDVVAYKGTGSNQTINHGLARVPEMMITKPRDFSDWWGVYHKDIGTNKYLRINTTASTYSDSYIWQNAAPTSSVFYIGQNQAANNNNKHNVMLLFASVAGISKVGSYTGNGYTGHTITVGFQPRFLLVKAATTTGGWYVFDTTRGWAAGNDASLQLQSTAGVDNSTDYGAPTSTGFTINITGNAMNGSGETYIYYAHA